MSKQPVTGNQRALVIWLDKLIYGLSQHWLAVLNLIVLIYVGLPFLAPVFMKAGLTGVGNLIYAAYSPLCHQFAFRSFFMFGPQPFYEAGNPIWQTVGIDPFDVVARFAAKAFVGNEQMGFKVAYCERDVAIYGAIFVGGLIFGLLRARGMKIKPANFILYAIVGIGPIALDGFSQLFSQPPFNWLTMRESTPLFRVLTGSLFGLMNVWLAFPYLEESFTEISADLKAKLTRVGELKSNE
jgi:uncharacterized membrane protein